jgi:hypothetical protein
MFDVLFAIALGLFMGLGIGLPAGVELAYKRQQMVKKYEEETK